MHWPQVTWLVLASMALAIYFHRHGKLREGRYNAWLDLVGYLIAFALLVIGGFFSNSACAQTPAAAARYRSDLVRAAHVQWGLGAPVAALAAQVHQESGWNPGAVSQVGAVGMSQFMPATAAWWCQLNNLQADQCQPRNPVWALQALVGYDKWLHERVRGADGRNRLAFALSAYNGGLGWVIRDKALASGKGLDPLVWFGSVDQVNAGRTTAAWRENRAYPKRIIQVLQPLYLAWGPGI